MCSRPVCDLVHSDLVQALWWSEMGSRDIHTRKTCTYTRALIYCKTLADQTSCYLLLLEQGPFVSAVAVLWMTFSIVVLSFPSDTNPDAQGMNYTVLVIGGWIFLCLAYYFFPVYGGIHWFKGPVSNIGSQLGSEMEDSKGSTDVEEKGVQVAGGQLIG